jgi:hypothetical protein
VWTIGNEARSQDVILEVNVLEGVGFELLEFRVQRPVAAARVLRRSEVAGRFPQAFQELDDFPVVVLHGAKECLGYRAAQRVDGRKSGKERLLFGIEVGQEGSGKVEEVLVYDEERRVPFAVNPSDLQGKGVHEGQGASKGVVVADHDVLDELGRGKRARIDGFPAAAQRDDVAQLGQQRAHVEPSTRGGGLEADVALTTEVDPVPREHLCAFGMIQTDGGEGLVSVEHVGTPSTGHASAWPDGLRARGFKTERTRSKRQDAWAGHTSP